MMAINLGWPFWRSAFLAFALGLAVALTSVVVSMVRHLITAFEFEPTYAINALYSVQLAVASVSSIASSAVGACTG